MLQICYAGGAPAAGLCSGAARGQQHSDKCAAAVEAHGCTVHSLMSACFAQSSKLTLQVALEGGAPLFLLMTTCFAQSSMLTLQVALEGGASIVGLCVLQ